MAKSRTLLDNYLSARRLVFALLTEARAHAMGASPVQSRVGRMMTRRNSQTDSGHEIKAMEARGMVAVGEMPGRDQEFDDLLSRAAIFQKIDSGCKLKGEAN